jgi:hypothetical protein
MRLRAINVFLATCTVLNVGATTMSWLSHRAPTRQMPEPFSRAELMADAAHVRVTPGDMTLRVVPRKKFDEDAGPTSLSLAAFTRINDNPCTIVIPEGWQIDAVPSRGEAHFADAYNDSVVAHEILHCLRGTWHPDWSVILARTRPQPRALNEFLYWNLSWTMRTSR